MTTRKQISGWGIVHESGAEIWDTEPLFKHEKISIKDKFLLLFYPKKWLLYRHIKHSLQKMPGTGKKRLVLDVGCGTGSAIIDLSRFLGEKVRVLGVDVVRMQVDLARQKLLQYQADAEVECSEENYIPLLNESISAIHTSDVLGHVKNVPLWLKELHRVLKPGGALAMFAESKLGRHAYIRNYFLKRGLNLDPHAQFHISLYSKKELKKMLEQAGFEVEQMYSSFWAKFFLHPEEIYPVLHNQNKFPVFRRLNRWLFLLKKKIHPFSTALAELYGLVEMLTVGRWVESQGYVILARKKVD